jgi:hypothetical protein
VIIHELSILHSRVGMWQENKGKFVESCGLKSWFVSLTTMCESSVTEEWKQNDRTSK